MELMSKLILCACVVYLLNSGHSDSRAGYFDRYHGYYLDGHVIRKIAGTSDWTCMKECLQLIGCFSINVFPDTDGVTSCELNNSSRQAHLSCFKRSLGREYLELVFPKSAEEFGTTPKQALADGWFRYQSSLYKLFREQVTWDEAVQRCRSVVTNLISFSTREEMEFVREVVQVAGSSDDTGHCNEAWIGLNDKGNEGNFTWCNGSPLTTTNWRAGEPNNFDNPGTVLHEENCVLVYGDGTWNDVPCNVNSSYICAKKLG